MRHKICDIYFDHFQEFLLTLFQKRIFQKQVKNERAFFSTMGKFIKKIGSSLDHFVFDQNKRDTFSIIFKFENITF
jgi:hypothetical protein